VFIAANPLSAQLYCAIINGFAPMSASLLGDEHNGWTTKSEHAPFVASDSRSTGTAKPRHAPVSVVGVWPNNDARPVYNLTVDNAHEYFANGVLVSNCDSVRYACAWLTGGEQTSVVYRPSTITTRY